MDHIPKPLYSTNTSIEVPLLNIIPYDLLGFSSFPHRHGFAKNGKLDLDDHSEDDLASLLQSWLYFGLLAELTGQPVDLSIFSRPHDQNETRILVDSRALETVLSKRHSFFESLSKDEKKMATRNFFGCIKTALDCSEIFDSNVKCSREPIPTIALSVKVLITTLLYLTCKDWESLEGRLCPLDPTFPGNDPPSPAGKLLVRKMQESGWCPFRLADICRRYNYVVLYHLLQTKIPDDPFNTGHEGCTTSNCCAYTVNEKEYVPRHVTDNCSCDHVQPPIDEVSRVIKKGRIPLASVHKSNGRVSIRITEASAKSEYITISHVWSHGLGNPESNTLPACQLEQINTYLSDIRRVTWHSGFSMLDPLKLPIGLYKAWRRGKSPPLFWLDTLCIPVADKAVRHDAIALMGMVYGGAAQVIVLDFAIQRLNFCNNEAPEILSYMPSSAWLGRCWTLQEGALGLRCYVQTAKKAINPFSRDLKSEIHPYETHGYRKQLHRRIQNSLLDRLRESVRVLDTKPTGVIAGIFLSDTISTDRANFAEVWNAISTRSTSKKYDRFAIFASLLRFNTHSIIGLTSHADKMRTMVYSLDDIPVSIFYNKGPRERSNEAHNDRWLPTLPTGSYLSLTPNIEKTPKGFKISSVQMEDESTGPILVELESPIPPNCQSLIVEVESSRKYHIEMHRSRDDKLDPRNHQGSYFLLEQDIGAGSGRGACLQVTKKSFGIHGNGSAGLSIDAIYDCPLGLSNAIGSLDYDIPVMRGSILTCPWSIIVEHGV